MIIKRFSLGKINGTKNVLFFCELQFITVLLFDLRLLNELKQGSPLKNGVRDFPFSITFSFIKVYIFVQQNAWTL